MPEITTWAPMPGGGRRRSFNAAEHVVTIEPRGGSDRHDAECAQLAAELAAAAVGITVRWEALTAERDAAVLRAEAAEACARAAERMVPPPSPARLLGPGCVRFDSMGRLWLLNKRETGWSSWGVICDGWDDLFRRHAVRITAHGTDEHGPWWTAEPEPTR